jgi:tRNA A37 threonylcarbamoyltransferase TsaD
MNQTDDKAHGAGESIDINDGEALDALGKKLGISREEVLNVIAITGPGVSEITAYVKTAGSPGTTP